MNRLVWFREDLRLLDNPALYAACEANMSEVIALFVATPGQWQQHDWSAAKIALIQRRLQALQSELAGLNIRLDIKLVDTFADLPALLSDYCQMWQVSDLFFNRDVGLNEAKRDEAVMQILAEQAVTVHRYDGRAIFAPGTILTGKGQPFAVFTPFKRRWLSQLQSVGAAVLRRPNVQQHSSLSHASEPSMAWCMDVEPDHEWPSSEQGILQRLRDFCAERGDGYHIERDLPCVQGTSKISPYLTIGALSGNQCVSRILFTAGGDLSRLSEGGQVWLSELIWRDFYRHLLEAYPELCKHQSFKPAYAELPWRNDPQQFQAWRDGRTGYPLVDAGMRQLNATGWMHNRVRMVVASFLTKHLLIDWRWGEKYFMQHLIDGDLAANNGGWQWAASTGADAVPYFRIFNPTLQAKRFDPEGNYIRQWVPELTQLRAPEIYEPHRGGRYQGCIGNYPPPIVEHAVARAEALAFYQRG